MNGNFATGPETAPRERTVCKEKKRTKGTISWKPESYHRTVPRERELHYRMATKAIPPEPFLIKSCHCVSSLDKLFLRIDTSRLIDRVNKKANVRTKAHLVTTAKSLM